LQQIGVLLVRERAKFGSAAAQGDWPRRARERPGRVGRWCGLNDRTVSILNLVRQTILLTVRSDIKH
jgi:hypothetical protein